MATFYKTDKKTLHFSIGTLDYMAPEIIAKHVDSNEKVDIWAVGVMTYKLLTHEYPFYHESEYETCRKI